ncbi:MAG: phage baseplate assembly protein V [Bacteroidales bacterium]|jgi:uncharacterized protein involved in type VI secretion and phage assembly|nr:phage baseplate assembly protein V [Bacteroidales bacterium]
MGNELNKVEVTLTVAGNTCYVVSMRLVQGFNCHHTFECVVDYEELDSKWMESPANVFNFLGQDVNIEIKHRDGTGTNLFTGVITQASYIGVHGSQNHIRISGCSPTIKLDGSKTMDSFMDMTLSGIVSEAVGNSGNGGSVNPQPKFSGKIDYIAQYEETCWEFLNRLSWIYGEWFFYDGNTCYFGRQDGKSETVKFESEMKTFDLSANLLPSMMKRYHYLVHDDNEIDKEAPKPSTAKYHLVAQGQSLSVYSSDATLPSPAVVLSMSELETVAKAEKNRATAGMLTMSGTSQTCKVKIGGKIEVSLPKKMETTKKDVDTFLVVSVVHEYDIKGDYRNTFTAIPDTVENIPMAPVYFPKAFSQLATVKSNDDEKKLGRVKIEFQWQKAKGKTTNWIRVKTPDAGKSDTVPKNRGFVFIPEKDDIVMIDFEYGDPNRPYVSGSIFSEKVSTGGDTDNKIKSITTRTGCTITIDDSDGSILIQDHKDEKVYKPLSKSKIKLDGKQNITIDADTSISLTSGKANITLKSEDDGIITMSAKTIMIDAGEVFDVQSGKTVDLSAGTDFTAIANSNASMNAMKEATVSGTAKAIVTAVGEVVLDGAIIKLN